MGNFLTWVVWLVAAAACLGTGLRVVTASNPFSSALSLMGNLASLAVPGRRGQYWNTAPEGRVPRAASGDAEARLRRAGVVAGEGRAA